jgi:hypothetical protein
MEIPKMNINESYISSLIDSEKVNFNLTILNDNYIFNIAIFPCNIKVAYGIKHYFQNGKVIEKDNITIIKITRQLEDTIKKIRNLKIYNINQKVKFLRFAYLYQKLIVENDKVKTLKELNKINKRINWIS